ncbi:pyrimidine-nucleoside phosphorylase [Paenibacillus thermoaerophilus]|uniref:Pyrimidine-nucleoside phosphorylase n=1 Tax=Paenibacillus thermoaerophilus TaxID=1215385 RepID=A0ABW2V3K5_9BACL|nr:pyrimidine-nucleoside phosphorylase [Paenibacillus thermoaerophilus]TMV12014.1 pyrimidine-nucleoside phosphorylase [Paenibacillus thermoaerophilus]
MRAVDLIRKKRDGGELTPDEIAFLIRGYVEGTVPDYQMSAWAMAVVWRGMTPAETASLTLEMARSGDQVDLGPIEGIKVDKHSTGGVGDKTTILLAPLVASAGVPVAKMSGRGLGHTGGTIDKLESIPGFRVELSREQFLEQVSRHGLAVISQSGNITPADKLLYGLRDVTATVESIPLIASSIMSKKIAAGADAIVLDVKVGGGAFMKTLDEAISLAEAMVRIGTDVGRETIAVLTSMDQPLGLAIGNALEVREAIETLKGGGPADLKELCLTLGAHMLVLGGVADDETSARAKLEERLSSGYALKKLKELIAAQGGSPSVVDNPAMLPSASRVLEVKAEESGYVSGIEAERLGIAAMLLGAGRETKADAIDPAAGVVLRRKVGDEVAAGDVLAELHVNERPQARIEEALRLAREAFRLQSRPCRPEPLVYAIVSAEGVRRLA